MELLNNYIRIKYYSEYKNIIEDNFIITDYSNCYVYGKFNKQLAKKIKFYFIKDGFIYFPIGLKKEVREIFTNEIIDNRKIKKFKFNNDDIINSLNYITLYNEQINAIKVLLENTNGIIKLPTGSGKTEIFISYLKLTNLKSLIIVKNIDLAKQTYKRCLQAGIDTGIIQGNNINENHNVVICTIQSSHKLQNNYECLIVDECHQISKEYIPIISNEMFLYRFGFSATPFTKEKYKNYLIKQFIGEIIFEIKSDILQEKEKIATPYINIIKIENPDYTELFDWEAVEKLAIIHNKIRNEKIIELCKTLTGQKLVLVIKIEHGKILQEMLSEQGIKSEFLNGDCIKEDREKILKEFEKNNNNFVLIGSKILFTGINLQNIFNLIIAGGRNSYIETIQGLGRALRNGTKSTVNIYDFLDCQNYITLKHSKNRIKYYKEEKYININYV